MNLDHSLSTLKRTVNFRICNVSGYNTELLEICSDDPRMHVLFIPGNPGVVSFYKDFLESLYELLGGNASITAIGHISHTKKNWELGKLFSLQQQIDHKVDFIKQELQNIEVPIVLVGHSIGSYISLETLRRSPKKLKFCIGLYPFLMFNPLSEKQTDIQKIAESSVLSALLSFSIASVGVLPRCTLRLIVKKSIGQSWSTTAVEAACSHLLQYHTFRNMIFMALTEFRELSEKPDWAFMRENQSKMAFLFGVDDHWGPLEMFEEIAKQAPGIALSIEREGHKHNFCCTEAGSIWVAHYTTELLEIPADSPRLHVLFIPGNPGVIALYKDFLESLYELLGGVASITAIAHISRTKKDWEHGRLFSLQEQIDHKVDFIRHELQNVKVPIMLVGHSIGSYISIEMLRRCKEKVIYCIALYPFLSLNPKSMWQPIIKMISVSSILSAIISFSIALLGMLPKWVLRLIVLKFIGKSCSATAVDAACSYLPQYHIMRNILFMTMTEFRELSKPPDWTFMMENKDKITFLFGDDDHWGPLQMFEEISKQVPEIALSIEREGHTHCFSCTEAGSVWVARHVACLTKNQKPSLRQ